MRSDSAAVFPRIPPLSRSCLPVPLRVYFTPFNLKRKAVQRLFCRNGAGIRHKPMKSKQLKAFSYLRVSGRSQIKGDGFTRQAETIYTYAQANRIEVVDQFRDEGVSGTTELSDRDGLAALLDRIDSNGVRHVLVERADRIARDLMVGEVIISQFRQLGVHVIEAASGNDLTADDGDPTKVLIRQILGAVAQFEKSVIVLKLRAARQRVKRNKGRCEGRRPYGELPGEKETMELMISLRRKPRSGRRRSYEDIAQVLNSQERFARGGKPWKAGTIRRIILRGVRA